MSFSDFLNSFNFTILKDDIRDFIVNIRSNLIIINLSSLMSISGLELSRRFYFEVVKPLLDTKFPNLQYDAALIGPGSEVLGFDDQISTDHHFGPRLFIFLSDEDFLNYRDEIKVFLYNNLPYEFLRYFWE